MSDTEDDPRAELARLVGDLRATVAWHARAGAWGVSAAATPGAAVAETEAVAVPEAETETVAVPAAETVAVAVPEAETETGRRTLEQIRADLGDCQRCKLSTTRNKIVFGVGSQDAPLMFVGEAPGADEDRLGDPFVGRAGELLDKMIDAMGWTRDAVYICNTIKCRPPGNRNPQADESDACRPFLHAQITSIAPRVIVTLGRPAANMLLENDAPISALRGRFHAYRGGIQLMPTFHPAYLLREPDRKRDTWADLKLVIAELARLGIAPPHPPRG